MVVSFKISPRNQPIQYPIPTGSKGVTAGTTVELNNKNTIDKGGYAISMSGDALHRWKEFVMSVTVSRGITLKNGNTPQSHRLRGIPCEERQKTCNSAPFLTLSFRGCGRADLAWMGAIKLKIEA